MYNILVCDDEKDIVSALRIYLCSEGFNVYEAYDGEQALELISKVRVDLALLDIMMPKKDGIETLAELRRDYNFPVIMLTAKSEDDDKVLGLECGADDYVTKPFNPAELIARVRSQLRRYTKLGGSRADTDSDMLRVGDIELCDRTKKVSVSGSEISLTGTEYEILRLLMSNPGKVYSSKDIYRITRNEEPYGVENTIAVHIRHLREKIEIDPAEPRYLKVVWAKGYKIEDI